MEPSLENSEKAEFALESVTYTVTKTDPPTLIISVTNPSWVGATWEEIKAKFIAHPEKD